MATTPKPSSRSLTARLTGKVFGVPVFVWALALLAVGYLIYRSRSSSSSSTPATDTTTSADTGTQPATDTSTAGTVLPDQTGGGAAGTDTASLNDQVLSQLAGFSSSLDALTQAVQSSQAFGDPFLSTAGYGATDGYSAPPAAAATTSAPSPHSTSTPAPAAAKPAASTKPAAPTRYYTFAPGKAPANRKGDQAPARGPAGTTLHFAAGRGYYYA